MSNETYKKYIAEEYYKAKAHYEAMKDLGVKYGVIVSSSSSENQSSVSAPTETEIPKPVTENKPSVEPTKPVSTDPEIVISGPTEYSMKVGDKVNFSIYIHNVSSSSEYTILPYGNPNLVDFDIAGRKTNIGYSVDIGVKAKSRGTASIKVHIKKDPSKTKTVTFVIN